MNTRRWSIGYRERRSELPYVVDPSSFTVIEPPAGVCYADPFLFENNDRTYLFHEQFVQGDYFSGVICVTELLDEKRYSTPRVVLEAKYHMSYPLVFSYENAIYMLPETRQNKTVELYQAIHFPKDWSLQRTLIPDIQAVDSTVLVGRDGLYLFTWMYRDGLNAQLDVFHASLLQGPWMPVSSTSARQHGRPAGSFLAMEGFLLRPSQCASVEYGQSIILNVVEKLTPTSYSEKSYRTIQHQDSGHSCGLHTYNQSSRYEVIDLWTG
jgi:hypothetical protein